jgi:hypothetical protein
LKSRKHTQGQFLATPEMGYHPDDSGKGKQNEDPTEESYSTNPGRTKFKAKPEI